MYLYPYDSYKQIVVCMEKVLDFAQKGMIRKDYSCNSSSCRVILCCMYVSRIPRKSIEGATWIIKQFRV